MEFSRYNYLSELDGSYFLYNSRTEELVALQPELLTFLTEHATNSDNLLKYHSSFYNYLCEKKFLVEEQEKEVDEFIKELREIDQSEKIFHLIINPTLDCNVHCWYCYEKRRSGTKMTKSVLDSTLLLIKKKLMCEKTELINLSFFGGEPLLAYKDVVHPLISKTTDLCKSLDKKMIVIFTSNGSLLNLDMLDYLKSLVTSGIPVQWQITLDGNNKTHNKIRKLADGTGTYSTIIKNVKELLKRNMFVTLRCNYTHQNVLSFYDVLDDLSDLTEKEKSMLEISFQQVWQDKSEIKEQVEKIIDRIRNAHFNVIGDDLISKTRCYGDKTNSVVINYNGDLFKCTANDFTQKDSEGFLENDGTLNYNDKYTNRMQQKFTSKACRKCVIFPICVGGCSQNYLYSSSHDKCVKNITPLIIENVIKKRIRRIINSIY